MRNPEKSGELRITHVITRLIVGGAQENTVASVLGLHQKPDLDVDLISGPTTGSEGSLEPLLQSQPELLRVLPNLVREVHPWKDAAALIELTRAFRKEKPHIVHTHSSKAGVLGRIAAHRAGVPVVIHTIHGPSFGAFQGRLANTCFLTAERFAGKRTTHFVSVANAMTEQYLKAGIGKAGQYSRVFSGFHLEPFLTAENDLEFRRALGIEGSDIVAGKIARLFELKGHDDLIDAAPDLLKANPSLKFLFVGGGPWEQRLKDKVRTLGVENRFVFTGLVPPTAVPRFVGVMDFLVHLSRREGLARALPQALAARKPVVAYDCDGAREVCQPAETGFLVQPGDQDELRKRILELAGDAETRTRLGSAGRRLVEKNFSTQRMVDDLHHLYLRLADEHALV
ncbi:MAG: putative glycosyltransferase EpsD [Verrucomicrobiales bacterium]|nr:putative glycosyltransferase EpsD [Verrucomicrobiales bacterium]